MMLELTETIGGTVFYCKLVADPILKPIVITKCGGLQGQPCTVYCGSYIPTNATTVPVSKDVHGHLKMSYLVIAFVFVT